MKTMETKYFNVTYSKEDKNILQQICILIDTTYENIINMFKLRRDMDKFELILCPNVLIFKEKAEIPDEHYKEWMVGNADYAQRKICILSPNVVTDRSFDDMLSVIKHEVIHIAFEQLQNANKTNIMISEGIAVALSGQINIMQINKKEYPEIRKLSDEKYFYENNGYIYSGVYVLHLLKKYGPELFKKIYCGEETIDKYIYDGFEKDAINELLDGLKTEKKMSFSLYFFIIK